MNNRGHEVSECTDIKRIERFKIMNHFTTFSQYEYVRPDFENAKELIRNSVDKIKNAGTKEAVSKVFKAVNDQQRHLRTMATVAEIRNTIDTTDPFYESEMQCFYENMPLVDLEMQEFQKTPHLWIIQRRLLIKSWI